MIRAFDYKIFLSAITFIFLALLLCASSVGEEEQKVSTETSQQAPKKSCIAKECHADLRKAKFIHDPILKNQCDACHIPVKGATAYKSGNAHKFDYAGKDGAMCYNANCHKVKKKGEYEKYVHEPIENRECIVCHDSHMSDNKDLLKATPSIVLCKKCHDIKKEKSLYAGKCIHGPVARGLCGECHYSHESPYKALTKSKGSEVCLSKCHRDEENQYWDRKFMHKPLKENCSYCHNPHTGENKNFLNFSTLRDLCFDCHKVVKKAVKNAESVHKVIFEKQQCLNCHNPHSADYWMILKKQFPKKFYPTFRAKTYDLCFSCHERTLVTTEFTTTQTGFRDGTINLHFKHVNGEKGHTCRVCHNPHAAKNPKLVAESFVFRKGVTLLTNYEQTPNGGKCSPTCHEPKTYDRRDILQKFVSIFGFGSQITQKKEQRSEKGEVSAGVGNKKE